MNIKPVVLKLAKNIAGHDFIVGDIHGHVGALLSQLSSIGFNKKYDRLICVGDLIDRGPESGKALDLLAEPWFFSVLGNHEQFMYSGLKENNSKHKIMWLEHGGDWIASTSPDQWPAWFNAIENLPLAIELTGQDDKTYGVIHADYPRLDWSEFKDLSEPEIKQCIWGREAFKSKSQHKVKGIDYLVHGHNVCAFNCGEGEQLGNRLYVEAGAYKGNSFIIKKI